MRIIKNIAAILFVNPVNRLCNNRRLKWLAAFTSPIFPVLILCLWLMPVVDDIIVQVQAEIAEAHAEALAEKAIRDEISRSLAEAEVMKEHNCLVEAIQNESEPYNLKDMYGRADVIFSRMQSGMFPATICGVVNQVSYDAHNRPTWQFSYHAFKLQSKSGHNYALTRLVAARYWTRILEGEVKPSGALWYHAWYMKPYWAYTDVSNCRMQPLGRTGAHFQYALNAGTSKANCLAALAAKAEKPVVTDVALRYIPVPLPRPAKTMAAS